MSLKINMDKKKAQEEMRRLMAERKKKDIKPGKIDNPLAKYNSAGQLTCMLCSSVVRSENVWPVHLNSKQHRNNVEQAKKLKEVTNNFTKVAKQKRQSPPREAPPQKKLKSILKNAPLLISKPNSPTISNVIPFHNEEIKRAPLNVAIIEAVRQEAASPSTSKETNEEEKVPTAPEQPIPEGFFDDPILDAKVRNIEYKDPVEEEWEKFQKEIKEEASASAEIIAGEQEEATAERQIEEIDEQIRIWSRVLDLELKKEETKNKKQEVEQMSEDEDEESDNEADLDEFLDWRAKKSYS